MKRNLEVVRKMLIAIESKPTEEAQALTFPGVTASVAMYHLRLLVDGGLVRGVVQSEFECAVNSLTWAGHELLDHLRDEKLWNDLQERAQLKGINITVDVLRA